MATAVVNVGYDSANYFVIAPVSGSRLLIDCGWPGTMGRLKAQMRRNGIPPAEVTHLLVTHYHPDHAGLVQELRNEGMHLLLAEPQLPFVRLLKNHMKPDSRYVEIVLEGSTVLAPEDSTELLESLGIRGQIVPTPGHSPDSVSLVLEDGKAFTGDLTHPLLLREEDTECWESWKRIFDLGATRIYPAHGKPYDR
jgi:endoribonuclease LACTB2